MANTIGGDSVNSGYSNETIAKLGLKELKRRILLPRLTLWDKKVYSGGEFKKEFLECPNDWKENIVGPHPVYAIAKFLHGAIIDLALSFDIAGGKELHNTVHFLGGNFGRALSVGDLYDIRAFCEERHMPHKMSAILESKDIDASHTEMKRHDVAPIGCDVIQNKCRGTYVGFNIYPSVNMPYYKIADYGDSVPRVNLPSGGRGDQLQTDGWETTDKKKVLNKGQLITIAGIYDTESDGNRRQLDELKTFVVTKDVFTNAAGEAMISIFPKIDDGALAAKSSADAAITVVGAGKDGINKGKSFRQGFFFHKSAMQFVNIQLANRDASDHHGYAEDPKTGLSVRYTTCFNINDMTTSGKFDIRGAVKVIRPEYAMRVIIGDEFGW